ncbi:LCP family protein [Actinoallomurus spadix]|uniref:LCP family protein n=1 Tax=Actinoallomurus spadix TaxID=79912 RepID=A0ABN0WZB5_9ACTN|nr:LCP family protein [Actinoallomurus spadix]MCO5989106.1 LCP family protein [Actinoallomurus spadix]
MNPDGPAWRPAAFLPRYGGRRWPYAVLDILLVGLLASGLFLETGFGRTAATAPYPGKPTWGLGEDWLLVTHDDPPEPGRGPRGGHASPGATEHRIDTVMELHLRHDGGRPLLVSLPLRTSATVAGYGPADLGTAYRRGGPRLLIRTVEGILHASVDHYVEVGLGGLAALVDALGGVRVCADHPVRASVPAAAGNCPNVSGGRALTYLRAGGLPPDHPGRAERRRRIIAAVLEKAVSPETALHPARVAAFARTVLAVVTVGAGDHLHDLVRLSLALCDGSVTAQTVPTVEGDRIPGVGRVVRWDPTAMAQLIPAVVIDRPEPTTLIPG